MKKRVKDESTGELWFDAILLLVVIGVLIFSISSVQAAPITIDFDTDANGNSIVAGQIIDDEYASFGIHISADNYRLGSDLDMGMAFDSGSPTGGDTDLRSNTLGMILILSEDGDVSDPDDEGKRNAGVINFNFDYYLTGGSMSFLDIEEQGHQLRFFNNGVLLTDHTIDLIPTANNGFRSQDFGDVTYNRIEVFMNGSGAITGLEVASVPEPANMILFGTGLIGIAAATRKRFSKR